MFTGGAILVLTHGHIGRTSLGPRRNSRANIARGHGDLQGVSRAAGGRGDIRAPGLGEERGGAEGAGFLGGGFRFSHSNGLEFIGPKRGQVFVLVSPQNATPK